MTPRLWARTDVVVIGAGAAGLYTALALAPRRVTLLTKGRLGASGASPLAQGGMAAALGDDDSPALHARDTVDAGAGLCDRTIVDQLTRAAPRHARNLAELGTRFDCSNDGRLALGREAAHSRRRIVHANGDGTGAEIVRALSAAAACAEHVRIEEEAFAEDLIVSAGRVTGVIMRTRDGLREYRSAGAVVLATGGSGRVYRYTTNPPESTGDGLAMAARAGAILADLEFVQFHPTALDVTADPLPLVTEALRGQGAVLVDERGYRFLADVHPAAELAPRDVVARAMWVHIESGHRVFLDARSAVGREFPTRFPTVFALCGRHGLDPRVQCLPVTPAAHYHMGGVASDARGRSSVAGLWVCGEAASTGVHGANRLASNSLLEAVVFGSSVAEDVRSVLDAFDGGELPDLTGLAASADGNVAASEADARLVNEIWSTMWREVGLVRTEEGLRRALASLDAASAAPSGHAARNLILVARLITAASLARRESRGGHYRSDFPLPVPIAQRRLYLRLLADGRVGAAQRFEPFEVPAARILGRRAV